jgi:hypothetical protein
MRQDQVEDKIYGISSALPSCAFGHRYILKEQVISKLIDYSRKE